MSLSNLNNLVKTGKLKIESFQEKEFTGLLLSGKVRLKDANNVALAPESRFDLAYNAAHSSRFDLAYNAAHSLALAALRWHGYRSDNRYIVFQTLPHTVSAGPELWRVLAKCHDLRNIA